MSKTLDEFQYEIGVWGNATFPKSNPVTVLSHLREEVDELWKEEWPYGRPAESAEEAADVFLLLLHYAHKRGFSLYDAAERKMAINRQRTWKTTPEPGGHIKHEVTS